MGKVWIAQVLDNTLVPGLRFGVRGAFLAGRGRFGFPGGAKVQGKTLMDREEM